MVPEKFYIKPDFGTSMAGYNGAGLANTGWFFHQSVVSGEAHSVANASAAALAYGQEDGSHLDLAML